MRMRDFMNGISNAYINDKSTSMPTDIVKPNKQTTTQIIKTLESIKDMHDELCDTYSIFDKTKGIDAKLQYDINQMLTTLSNMHLTKADKKAMIKAQYAAAQQKLADEMKQLLNDL